jgi:DNA-directed RNA polymerase alpha subunit
MDDAFFQNLPHERKQEFVAVCPARVFTHVPSDDTIQIAEIDRCTFCRECQEYLEDTQDENKIVIDQEPDRFFFTVESTGVLKPQTIVIKAFAILKKKLETLMSRIERLALQ